MKPAPFEYHAPSTVDEVLELLAEHGDEAKLLAGGQSLIPTMNFRLAQPEVLVDMNKLSGLAGIAVGESCLGIGAMVRQRTAELNPDVRRIAPLVADALPWVAHPQIRNRGTVGGNLAHADPRSELPAVALATGARFHLRSREAARTVDAADFFVGLFSSVLEPTELLVEVEIPASPAGTGTAFLELSRRKGDYALVGVACQVRLSEERFVEARLAFLSAADRPVLAESVCDVLVGQPPSESLFDTAADAARSDVDPIEDVHASVAYRTHLAGVLTRRVLRTAVENARRSLGPDRGKR